MNDMTPAQTAEARLARLEEGGPPPAPQRGDAPASPTGVALPRVRIEAFTVSPEGAAAVREVAQDRRAARASITVVEGGFDAAFARLAEAAAPDLAVIEHDGAPEELEAALERLAELCPEGAQVLVAGGSNDVDLYRSLLRLGVTDYLTRPIRPMALLEALQSAFDEREEAETLGSVVAFAGARGGVGASTLAQNVADLLHRDHGAAAILIDADIGFGAAAMQFDVDPGYSLADALREKESLTPELLEKYVHWRGKSFGVLAAPTKLDQLQTPEVGRLAHVVEQARRLVRYVVVDLPSGLPPFAKEVFELADEICLVCGDDLA
ncbi:MAG: hypothetical protein AAF322_21750, partial [Pseudomonadota bacterium]